MNIHYEYDFVDLKLSQDQMQVVQLGLANIEEVNKLIKDTINLKAKDAWEPLYPFSVPYIWFRRLIKQKNVKRTR